MKLYQASQKDTSAEKWPYKKSLARWYTRLVNKLGEGIAKRSILYYILAYTWGLIGTLLGYLVLIFLLPFGKLVKTPHCSIRYFRLKRTTNWGFSIGNLIVTGNAPGDTLLYHELGHTVHNALFGPFVFIFVYIPSFIRYWYITLKDTDVYYNGIWFESTATHLGTYLTMIRRQKNGTWARKTYNERYKELYAEIKKNV